MIFVGALQLPQRVAEDVKSKRHDRSVDVPLDFVFDFIALDRFVA